MRPVVSAWGDMRDQFAFEEPVDQPDGYGGRLEGWAELFWRYGRVHLEGGGETAAGGALAGTRRVVVEVIACALTRSIGADWRMRDRLTGEILNIRVVEPTPDRCWIRIHAEAGVA